MPVGWSPLAGGQEPAQGQDQLMQRGQVVSVKPGGPCLPGSAGVSLQSGLGQGSHLLSFESQFGVFLPHVFLPPSL